MTNEEILAALFLIAPQFQTTDPVELARLNAIIDLLKCTICPNDFGKCYVLAFAYYLAHVLLINANAGTIGLATSLSEGGLSISFGTGGIGGLDSTVFGRQFLALRGTGRTKAFVSTPGLCGAYPYPYFYPYMGSGYPGPGCC